MARTFRASTASAAPGSLLPAWRLGPQLDDPLQADSDDVIPREARLLGRHHRKRRHEVERIGSRLAARGVAESCMPESVPPSRGGLEAARGITTSPSPSTCKPFGHGTNRAFPAGGPPGYTRTPILAYPPRSKLKATGKQKSCKPKPKRLSGVSPIRDAPGPRVTPTRRLHRDAVASLRTPETTPTPSKHMRKHRMVRAPPHVKQKAPTILWGPPPGSPTDRFPNRVSMENTTETP